MLLWMWPWEIASTLIGEFQKEPIRILALDSGSLPCFTVPREDDSAVLIVAVHLPSPSPLHYDSWRLRFILYLKATRRPVTPHPPWDLSIHTCSAAQRKYEPRRPRHYISWSSHSRHILPSLSIFSFCSDNSLSWWTAEITIVTISPLWYARHRF